MCRRGDGNTDDPATSAFFLERCESLVDFELGVFNVEDQRLMQTQT